MLLVVTELASVTTGPPDSGVLSHNCSLCTAGDLRETCLTSGLATRRDGVPGPTQTQASFRPPPFLPVRMLASDCRSAGPERLRAGLLSLLRIGPSREPGRPQLDSSCVGRHSRSASLSSLLRSCGVGPSLAPWNDLNDVLLSVSAKWWWPR